MNEQIFDELKVKLMMLYGDEYKCHLIKELGIQTLSSETSIDKKFWLNKYLRCSNGEE